MLVLTRKTRQTIRVGDQITISILRVKGRAVSVGIEAPGDVRVMRGELVCPEDPAGERRNPAGNDERSGEESEPEQFSPAPIDSPAPIALRQLSTQRVNAILALRRRVPREEQPVLVAS